MLKVNKKSKIIVALILAVSLMLLTMIPVSAVTWPTTNTTISRGLSTSPQHDGIDIKPVTQGVAGDVVKAFSGGSVIRKEENSSAGWTIDLAHNTTSPSQFLVSRYAHMTNPSNVSGATTTGSISEGTKIGEMNTTGSSSTGVHLHFEVRYDSSQYTTSSSWYKGTPACPIANWFPGYGRSSLVSEFEPVAELEGVLDVNYDVEIYLEYDSYATEILINDAIYIERDGIKFDVRWIIEMTDDEIEFYNITEDEIAFAINALK